MENSTELKKRGFKLTLILFLVIFVAGNIGFYLKERSKWIYDGQPYPEAKEWLIPANMMLVYGTTLAKLPFVDERSWILKPVIDLQDYFVSKWQENLPDDDAEKYLGWYMFRLRTYLIPNAGKVNLAMTNEYTLSEVITINDKVWEMTEAFAKYEVKDKAFKKMRYAAFLNSLFFYMKNVYVYWSKRGDDGKVYTYLAEMYKDQERIQRFKKLYDYIPQIESFHKNNHPKLYKEFERPYFKDMIMYLLTDYLLDYQTDEVDKEVIAKEEFCNQERNEYLKKHFESKENLRKLVNQNHTMTKDIKLYFRRSSDLKINTLCTTIPNNKTIEIDTNKGAIQWQILTQ